jgi:hypothetical protein
MRIHVGNAELVPDLIRYFEAQADCVVLQVGDAEIEVSLLGSYRDERHNAAVERLLAGFWMTSDAARPDEHHHVNGKGTRNGNGATA